VEGGGETGGAEDGIGGRVDGVFVGSAGDGSVGRDGTMWLVVGAAGHALGAWAS